MQKMMTTDTAASHASMSVLTDTLAELKQRTTPPGPEELGHLEAAIAGVQIANKDLFDGIQANLAASVRPDMSEEEVVEAAAVAGDEFFGAVEERFGPEAATDYAAAVAGAWMMESIVKRGLSAAAFTYLDPEDAS
jgi:hypothetical protein